MIEALSNENSGEDNIFSPTESNDSRPYRLNEQLDSNRIYYEMADFIVPDDEFEEEEENARSSEENQESTNGDMHGEGTQVEDINRDSGIVVQGVESGSSTEASGPARPCQHIHKKGGGDHKR
ncbi:hypothetical protein JAAARDRAFT_46546 [Jaapia argillacea MUCL 33604]|uniref:Uncharacterized protein n=1 Tax=Jaapia argillacea MUCL 33604 TaxID=933084 RepID=A0A067Q8G3_9AGAM|nr:hypothetical protein JAAARDRAFT_46546 [Jaapia argillacea MUCL 33604]